MAQLRALTYQVVLQKLQKKFNGDSDFYKFSHLVVLRGETSKAQP